MRSPGYRLSIVATLSAIAGVFLIICDLSETPATFENLHIELACFVPLIVWLVGYRLRLATRSRF